MNTPTLVSPPTRRMREGAGLWMFKLFAGLMIVALLGIHYVVNHLVSPTGLLSYDDVIRYYQNPIIPIMEAFFLVFVVTHALVGMRGIVLDLNPSDRVLKWLDGFLFLLGSVSIVYGIWLILVIVSKGLA
jgi:succinate dehydrogenase hydrophobic anchor subunit